MQAHRTEMKTTRLGNTDMSITPIGFGAWALGGGGWQFGWGPQDDRESIAAIHQALDLGINWIDTAAVYGLGHSEEVVGRALQGLADKPYVFTKCQRVWNDRGEIFHVLKRDSLRRECEASLRRLGVEAIDLYQIHWPKPEEDLEEGWAALAELKKEGQVRWIGVSNFGLDDMRRAEKVAPVSSLQPPYSLLQTQVESEILPFCQEHHIGVIAYSPMASGLLSGKMTPDRIKNLAPDDWRSRDPEFNPPRLTRNLKLVDLLREIGDRHGVEPGVIAISWTLRNPAVTAAIVGARRPAQVDGIFPANELRLTQQEIRELDAFIEVNR